MNSRKIEAIIEDIKQWSNKKYGNCPFIYCDGGDPYWIVRFVYYSDNKEINEKVASGLTDLELIDYLTNGDINMEIDRLYSSEYTPEEWMMIGANRFQFCSWNFEWVKDPYVWTDTNGEEHREYYPRFIMEAEWTCSRQHMMEKWKAAVDIKNTDAYFPRFYAELDGNNRVAMLRWIMKNYTSEQKLSL